MNIDKFQNKRGLKANLPILDSAELGFVTDEKRLFVGTGIENIELAMRNDFDSFAKRDDLNRVVSPVSCDKAVITFIDDDGTSEFITRMKNDVYDVKGIKVTVGIVTDTIDTTGHLTLAQLKQIQLEGHELASHSKTHSQTIFQDNLINEPNSSYDIEFGQSKQWFRNNGLGNVDTIIYPFANFDSHSGVEGSAKRIKALAKKYYTNGVNADGWMNECPLDNMYIKRLFLDKQAFDVATVKGFIDIAIANKYWLIFGIHSFETGQIDATYMNEIIDYIQSKNVEIMTFGEAVKIKGNLLSVGEFTDTDKGLFVGVNGKVINKLGGVSINDLATSSTTETYSVDKINEKINKSKECVNFSISHQYTAQNKPLKDTYTGEITKTIDYVYYDSGIDINKTQKVIITEGNKVTTREFTYVSGTDYINSETVTITYI